MIAATRRWVRRYRTPVAIGFGVIGVGYVATQYVLGKISDARERMSSDRIAREKYLSPSNHIHLSNSYSLRRRFEQNQEDCTFTVLALLPTATDNILAELETERITFELQQQKAAKLAKNGVEVHASELGSGPPSVTDEDSRSMASFHSESGVHASQMGVPSAREAGDGPQDGGEKVLNAKKSKLQLWNDLKISGTYYLDSVFGILLMWCSNNESFHADIHPCVVDTAHTHPTQPPRPTLLPLLRRLPRHRPTRQQYHLPRKPRRRLP